MKNKFKIFLGSMLGLLLVSISNTHAVTFYGDNKGFKMLSGYSDYTINDYKNGYFDCITETYAYRIQDHGVKTNKFCEDGYASFFQKGSYSFFSKNSNNIISDGYYRLYHYDNSSDIFSLLSYKKDDSLKEYRKITLKNVRTKMYNIKSQRGDNVYSNAFVDGIGFVLASKDDDQVRLAHVVANSYVLDGFGIVATPWESYVIDTYANKLYFYKQGFYTYEEQKEGAIPIFPKLWNIVPDNVYDIVRNVVGDYKMYYTDSLYLSFDIQNETTGKKADLAELRENIKKGIKIISEDMAEYLLGQTPEELGIGDGKPNTENQTNTNSNPSQPTNNGSEAKKACVDYYTKMKAFTAHSNGCRGEATTGEQFEYWENILFGSYEIYNTWDKARYWRCWQFGRYKESVVKQLGEKYSTFQQEWETLWIDDKAENVDVNALCSHIVVENPKFDPFNIDNLKTAFSAGISYFTKGDTMVKVGSGEVSQYELDKLIGKFYSYDKACREKTYLPTPDDSWASYVIGYDFFFNSTNNDKVCQYRDKLYNEIIAKFSSSPIQEEYRQSLKKEMENNYITGEFANIFNPQGGIDGERLKKSSSENKFSPVGLNSSELGLSNLFSFFSKDYQAGIDKSYNLLSSVKCGSGIGIKEWDYIMWFFVFIFGYTVLKGRN